MGGTSVDTSDERTNRCPRAARDGRTLGALRPANASAAQEKALTEGTTATFKRKSLSLGR